MVAEEDVERKRKKTKPTKRISNGELDLLHNMAFLVALFLLPQPSKDGEKGEEAVKISKVLKGLRSFALFLCAAFL